MNKEQTLQLIGTIIKEHREDLGLTQEQLSVKCGVHKNRISLIEKGEVNITFTTLITLFAALQIPVDKIGEFIQ